MPSFANVPRPATPENKVAVADLFQVKTSANAPAGSEEITHLGTFFRDTPASPKAPSPNLSAPISEDIGDDDNGPAPSARRVVREITARSPRLRAIISREADAFIAQNLDSQDSTVAVFATRRLKIPVGMVTIEGGPKVKVFDPDASARKIGAGLADGGVNSVFVENQTQLDRLIKCLDGGVSVPGRTGLKLEAIVVPKDLQLDVPARHAPLIKSLENYEPGVDREGLKLTRRDRLEESAELGFENPLSALTAPGSNEAKTELRMRAKDSKRAARLGLDLAESGNLLELAVAEVFNASLRMERPISTRDAKQASAVSLEVQLEGGNNLIAERNATSTNQGSLRSRREELELPESDQDAGWTVFDKGTKVAAHADNQSRRNVEAVAAFGHMDLKSTDTPLKAHDPAQLAAEVPADILNTTTLPATGRAEVKQQIEASGAGVELTPESVEGLHIAEKPKADNLVKRAGRVISAEDLEKLENSGALGKIAALAITTEEEFRHTGNKPSSGVLAQKHMLDAMSPALRIELGQLFENVTGQTTIIFAPRESVVSEAQADFYVSMPLAQSSGSKTTPRGQILNINEALAEQQQDQASGQLEVAA